VTDLHTQLLVLYQSVTGDIELAIGRAVVEEDLNEGRGIFRYDHDVLVPFARASSVELYVFCHCEPGWI
jgi:hypothetical protein